MRNALRQIPATPWLVYFLLTLVVLAPGTASLPLIDRDEPRFAQAAREMMERRDWVIPTFNGDYRFDKPPLIYWLMIAAYRLFGVMEWTARLPSILCAFLLAWLTHRAGAHWFSTRAGWLAGLMTLTHLQMIFHGRAAVADMPMILAVFVAQMALIEKLAAGGDKARDGSGWFWRLYGALGLGFLAKGPVALLIPFLSVPVYWLLAGRPPLRLARLRLAGGLLVTAAVIGAWGVPALWFTRGEFARVGLGHHVVKRGLEAFEGHGAPFFFYLLSAPISLLPWSRFLPMAFRLTRERREAIVSFLASWIIVTFALFSVYSTKLPHYVMPCFPAIFLLIAAALDRPSALGWRFERPWNVAMGSVGVLLAGAALSGALIGYVLAPWPLGVAFTLAGFGLLLLGLLLAPAVLSGIIRDDGGGAKKGGWWGRALAAGLLIIAGTEALGRGLRATTATTRALPVISHLPEDARCAFIGYREPSVVFYSGRRWQTVEGEEALERFARSPGSCVILLQLAEHRLGAKTRRPGEAVQRTFESLAREGFEVYRVDGLNPARGAYVQLAVAVRRGDQTHVE